MGNKIILKPLLIFTFLFILLSINSVSALEEEIRFTHQQNVNLTIFEKCRVDGAVCDSGFVCNMTIINQDQELIIDNQNMTRGDIYYNFTTNITQNNGVYETTVDCTNISDAGSNTFFYRITPNGSPPMDEGQSITTFLSILMIIIIAIVCLSLSYKINNGWVSLGFLSFAVLLLIFAFGMIFNILELSIGTFDTIISNYSALYIVFVSLVTVGGIGLIVFLIKFVLTKFWESQGRIDKEFDD